MSVAVSASLLIVCDSRPKPQTLTVGMITSRNLPKQLLDSKDDARM